MAYNYQLIDGRKRDVLNRLRGALVMGPLTTTLPVGGLDLVFTSPAVTVTFSGSPGDRLTLAQIKAQIEAASASLKCEIQSVSTGTNHIHSAPTAVVPVAFLTVFSTTGTCTLNAVHATSTAAPYLGLPNASVSAVGIAKANIVSFSQGATPDLYAVLYEL